MRVCEFIERWNIDHYRGIWFALVDSQNKKRIEIRYGELIAVSVFAGYKMVKKISAIRTNGKLHLITKEREFMEGFMTFELEPDFDEEDVIATLKWIGKSLLPGMIKEHFFGRTCYT